MTKRDDKRRRNRRPHWNRRFNRAVQSASEGVATQYDLARTNIHGIALLGERDKEWRALTGVIGAFNVRFTGEPAPEPAPESVPRAAPPTGRLAGAERSFKARHAAIEAAAAAYDTARKFLRRVPDGAEQEAQWRQLEEQLRQFNERFSRERAAAAAAATAA